VRYELDGNAAVSSTLALESGKELATRENAWKKSDHPVRYFDSLEEVALGDRIEIRSILFKKKGTVNYVPGISEYHSEMEFNCLYWVGVSLDSGVFTGTLVDPDTGCLRKNVKLVSRGDMSNVPCVPDAPFE